MRRSPTPDIEFAGREVIEKKQRLGALHNHVVDAHGDQIDAHGVVTPRVDGKAQLGADAVGSRHQHGLAVAVQRHFDQGAEAADAAQHFATHGAPDVGLDSFDEFLAGVDIDSGLAIGDGGSLSHSGSFHCERAGRPGRRGRSASCGILPHTMAQNRGVFSRRFLRPAAIFALACALLCPAGVGFALSRAELYQATAPARRTAPRRRRPRPSKLR